MSFFRPTFQHKDLFTYFYTGQRSYLMMTFPAAFFLWVNGSLMLHNWGLIRRVVAAFVLASTWKTASHVQNFKKLMSHHKSSSDLGASFCQCLTSCCSITDSKQNPSSQHLSYPYCFHYYLHLYATSISVDYVHWWCG